MDGQTNDNHDKGSTFKLSGRPKNENSLFLVCSNYGNWIYPDDKDQIM